MKITKTIIIKKRKLLPSVQQQLLLPKILKINGNYFFKICFLSDIVIKLFQWSLFILFTFLITHNHNFNIAHSMVACLSL
jgi:hypothetical protein